MNRRWLRLILGRSTFLISLCINSSKIPNLIDTIISLSKSNKSEIVKAYGKNEKDTGSAAVQIAMMTAKIAQLTEHLKSNKKDFATKRGLLMMVGKRKKLLSYVKSKNLDEYRDLIKKLKIRG